MIYFFSLPEWSEPPNLASRDIELVEGEEPGISTCSNSVTFSVTNAVKMLEMALKYTGGLGTV